jgi:hypothetical protein
MGSSVIPIYLDEEMLRRNGAQIAPKDLTDKVLKTQAWAKNGLQPSRELGNRFLIYYMIEDNIGSALEDMIARNRSCYLTPTALRPDELVTSLNLPRPGTNRRFAQLVDPAKLKTAYGPRQVDAGTGLEYLAAPDDVQGALHRWPMHLGN